MKLLMGLWMIVHAEMNGQEMTSAFESQELKITASGYQLLAGGTVTDVGLLTIFQGSNALDIEGTEGPNKGAHLKCIYKLEGDSLIICYNLKREGARPTELKSTAENKFLLIIYKKKDL